MRVVCTEIAFNGPKEAVVRFNTQQEDADKPQKGMCQICMTYEQAQAFLVGEEYEMTPPRLRPKVVPGQKAMMKGKK